jgi:hypothetical protein
VSSQRRAMVPDPSFLIDVEASAAFGNDPSKPGNGGARYTGSGQSGQGAATNLYQAWN